MSQAHRLGRLAALLAAPALLAGLSAQAPRPATPAARSTPSSAPTAAVKAFQREGLASEGVRLEAALKSEAPAGGKSAAQWRREAEAAAANEETDAEVELAARAGAVSADPSDAQNWLGYARAANAIGLDQEETDYALRNRLRNRAAAAAYQGYLRARAPADEAAALALLGEVQASHAEWRASLDAYRASLGLKDDGETRKTFEALRAEHGFRILDYKVDSDAAAPRACFTLSEALAAKTDYAPFVAVSGSANAAVTAEGSQVCVDGLKHGERYAFVLRQGLPSADGEGLLKSADYEVYVRDRSPQVRFTGRNYVLPRTGQAGIPLVSVNAGKLDVEVLRVGDRGLLPTLRSEQFLGQLSGATAAGIANEKGVRVWKGSLDTAKADLNREAVTAFPVLQAVGTLEPGLYLMLARPSGTASASEEESGGYETQATQWFVVSDLGLTAFKGRDGVHVFARSLATAKTVPGAEIRLIARNNDVLATGRTDALGHAAFAPGLARGEGGVAPGIVVAQLGDDYGFLDLAQGAFDLSDRGVKGRPAAGAVEAYVFPERGVYRSGETVQITALLRDAQGVAVPGLPLTLVAKRPDGVEYRRVAVPDGGLGGRALSLPMLPGAMRGTWRVSAYTDPKAPAIGEATWLVEDYVPERLEVTLTPATPTLRKGAPATIDVAARYLYGAPGAGLDVSGSVSVQAAAGSGIKGLDGYAIGLGDEPVEATTAEIDARATTDAQGHASVSVPVQEVESPRPLEARITLQVGEPGGRALSRSLTLPILPAAPVLALRKTFGDLSEGGTATFDLAMAAPDGRRLAQGGVTWSLVQVERTYQWYRQNGNWSFEPVKTTRRVADGRVDVTADAPARIAAPVALGTYRLEASVAGQPAAAVSVAFTVGWGGAETADVPDLLDLTLDKPAYAAGERLRARLKPKFSGTATLAVVSDRVHDVLDVAVPDGGATVEIPVKAEWGAGAYLVATAYRPLDQAAKRMPGRALGLAWFSVDRDKRALAVSIEAPAKTRPRETLTVPVRLAGLLPGEEARVTLAAVDVGILNLTRYEAPNPVAYFFGQKALGPEIRDLYGYLIDGMQGTLGAIRSGGDGGAAELSDAPPTQAPLAIYSGVVTVGPDGTAQIPLPLPAFNGTARVMVTAWTKTRVGQAQADVIVRDPVVLTGTLPRFLNVGDRSRFFVALDNVEGAGGEYTVDLDPSGPVVVAGDAVHRTLRLEAGAKGGLVVPITAAGPGASRVDVALSGPGLPAGVGQSFALAIGPGTGALVRRSVRPIEPGASLDVTPDLVADMLPGTGAVSVAAGAYAGIDVAALLHALDRYPYGCSEQTVSRAMPLLYVNRLAASERLGLEAGLDDRVRAAIERVLSRQDSNGAFGLWSAGSGGGDLWLDAYVTDFLTRARERGFAVPQPAFAVALDRLRNAVANASEVRDGGMDIAYAAYVLARNGRPVMGDLRYLADTKLGDFATPLGRGQIAAALALLGDRGRAERAFESAMQALRTERDGGGYRADYGSRLRDGAGLIALSAETGLTRDALKPLAAVVSEERGLGRTTSTQENAWMVLAVEGLSREGEALALSVDGVPAKGPVSRTFPAAALENHPVRIANAGREAVQAVVSVSGNPISPEPAASHGYAIERSYHRLDGSAVDVGKPVRQNDRLVVVLKVTEDKAGAGRLLLVDRLPAGFEIDNPRLLDTDALAGLSFAKTDVQPTYTEFRDDRFVAAYERTPDQSAFFSVVYTVRAVAPGVYVHPGATIEDMYRPDRYGRTGFGSVEVVAK